MMQIQAYKMVELMWSVVLNVIPENKVSDFMMNPSSMLHEAARVGNVEFLKVLTNEYPDLAFGQLIPTNSCFPHRKLYNLLHLLQPVRICYNYSFGTV